MEILILLILGLILAAIYMFFIKKDGPIVVTELVVYPIKGAGFVRLTEANVFEQGIAEDRRWFLTNDNKEVITQRENTKILKIQPKFVYSKEGKLTHMTLSYENMPDFNLEIKGITTNVIPITWRTAVFNGQEETQGVAEWLSKALQAEAGCRLWRIVKDRKISDHPRYLGAVSDEFMTRAPDVAQFLIISEESCEATRRALPAHKQNDIDMSVYRANIVVRGVNRPFEEDWWENFNIGDITFQSIGKCSRCKVTTVSPKTLEWDPNMEPVTTLRRLNGNGTKGYLGMHCVRKNNGKLRVGDEVRVVSRRKFPDI